MTLIKKEVDEWLDEVDYSILNTSEYVPTQFALTFVNYIKLVNKGNAESHVTPPVHMKMLDKVVGDSEFIANLVWRGGAKTTVFMEYMAPYLAIFRYIPNFGEIDGFIYVSDSMENGVKTARKNIEHRYWNSEFLQYYLPQVRFTDNYLEFTNRQNKVFGIKMFGAKTGLRGTKLFGKRPKLAILDDLVSDEDARSKASMSLIKETINSGVIPALDPSKRKVIFNGTPFNKEDILIEAVESGAWDVNVWPVCEKFPCTEAEYKGAWPDRFSYTNIKKIYDYYDKSHKLSSFYQEYMLRISSEDERLVQDAEINWYKRPTLLANKHNFNFYITTDFATSSKQTADFSVISVWAYSANGDWFWIDGFCERTTMDKTIDSLFFLAQTYNPEAVGIEVTGQQGGFIAWIRQEMIRRNIWFNFATSGKNNEAGIRPTTDKLTRFNMVVPWFKAGKMYFPEEMRQSTIMGYFMQQIRLATRNGLKGKDDCLDTVSQLGYLRPWKPAQAGTEAYDSPNAMWDEDYNKSKVESNLSSYIV